ncbi:MAG: hypothetical protein WDW38_001733 [Sanguina aurantia]
MDAAAALYVRDLASPLGASAAGNGVTTSSSLSSGDTNKSQNSSRPLHSKPAGLEELDSDSLEDDNPDDDALETQQQPQQHPQSQPPATSLHQPLLVVSPDPALLSLQAEWTPQEQLRLVEVLSRYPVEKHSALERYLHVAAILPNKSTRDVAHRVHSMQQLSLDGRTRAPTAEELRLRAAQQQQAAIAMSASRQPSLPTPFSRLAINRPPTPPLVPLHPNIRRLPTSVLPALPPGGLLPAARLTTLLPSAPAPVGSGSSLRSTEAAIPALMPGSATSEAADAATAAITTALDGNYVLLQSIKENMIAFNVSDNTDLLVRFRDNLLIAQLHLNSATGVLGSMPQLPVSINLDLAARFLPAAPSSTGARAMSGQLPLPVPLPSQPLHPAAQPAIPSAPSPGLDSSAAPAPAAPVQSVPGVIPVMHMPVPSFAHTGSGGLSMPGGASIPILSHAYPYTMPGTFPGLAGLPIPMPNMTAGSIPNLPAGFPTMENFFSVAMSATGGATAGSLPAFPVVPFQFPLGMPMMPQTAALALQARLMMAQGLGGAQQYGADGHASCRRPIDVAAAAAGPCDSGEPESTAAADPVAATARSSRPAAAPADHAAAAAAAAARPSAAATASPGSAGHIPTSPFPTAAAAAGSRGLAGELDGEPLGRGTPASLRRATDASQQRDDGACPSSCRYAADTTASQHYCL